MHSLRKLRALTSGALILFAGTFATVQSVAANYLFTHLAGPLGGPGSADGPGLSARFFSPEALATDRSGNVYVADNDNHTIRKITSTGVVSTLTSPDGSVILFSSPSGVAVDSSNNVYVTDTARDTIYMITPGGVLTTLAGAVYPHYTIQNRVVGDGRDGTGTDARFLQPTGLATDSAGNVYVADSGNHTIRKIAPGGVVTTLAGTAGQFGSTDGTGSTARFSYPNTVTTDGAGNVYVSDASATIRKVTPGGVVTTLAGTFGQVGSVDGIGAVARFFRPRVAADSAGNIFVADTDNGLIRRVTPDGIVNTLAGTAGLEGWTDGIGAAARFSSPTAIAVDSMGNVFVGDSGNFTIRKIAAGAVVTTFAGMAGGFGTLDGTGAEARFHFPQGLTLDRMGNLYVADFYNHSIRKITPSGVVTTFAGLSGSSSSSAINGTSTTARFYYPSGIAVDNNGNVYVAEAGTNSIRKITADGVVTTFAGPTGAYIFGSADGTGTEARFAYPEGVAVDSAGTIYVADTGNQTIRKITQGGVVTTLAGTAGKAGGDDGTSAAARFNSPLALAVDEGGNVFVADSRNHTIRKITPTGVVTTFAGAAGEIGSADGVGTVARFNNPCGVVVDNAGNLFVGDANNLTIRKITPDGTVSTIGGKTLFIGSADGIGPVANFYYPSAIAIDSAGTLYVADEFNHAIRKGQLAGPPVITTQPLSQSVTVGGNVQLSVIASGVPSPTYQWYFNGAPFSGATGANLSFATARTTDAGEYTVVVTNELGNATSNKATLTVSAAPAPSPTPGSGGSSGGGSIEGWLVLALLALGHARAIANRDALSTAKNQLEMVRSACLGSPSFNYHGENDSSNRFLGSYWLGSLRLFRRTGLHGSWRR